MDFKKVLDQTVRELKREVNKSILKVPEIEQKVLDATSNEPWGPHGTVMGDIAQATRNHYEFQMIMVILWKRLSDTGRNWRHVYKALTVLEYLVAHGSERVIDEIREHAYQISTLADFQYVEPNGKDQGINVRKKSQTLVALVNDKDKIGEVRQKANENRDKYRGVSSTGGMYKPSSYNSTRGSYGGDRYEEDSYSRYGRRDDDRYGKDRDFDRYREDDRYGRDSDRSGRPGDRYRDDRNRDYDNDEDQYSSRRGGDRYSDKSRSYEKDLDRAQDDADHHSSRGAGGRHSDHGEDDKGTAQKPSTAPPSYEAASQSPDLHATRDQSATSSSDNKAPSANKTSDDFDDFDDFNPRASSAPSQLDDLFNQSEPRMAVQPPPGLSNVASDFFGDSLSSGVTLAPPPVNNFPVQALAGDLFGNDPFKVEASGFSGTATVQTAINPPPSYTLPAGNGVQASVQSSSTAFIKPPPSHTTLTSGSGVAPAPAAGGIAFSAFAPTAPSPPSQTANPTFGGDDLFGFDTFNVSGASSGAPQPAFSLNSVTTPQPAIPGLLQANQPPPTSFSASQPTASQGQPISSNIYTKPQQEKRFETKSTVWADSLSKGLIDLNIGGPKSNPLADIGIDFDLLRTERVKEERVSSGKSVTTGMGKAMGSGSGLGVAGASAIVPPAAPMMMNNMRMAPTMGMNPMGMGMGMGAGMGMVPPMMQMGGVAMRPGMGMNTGMGGLPNQQQQYGGFR